MNLQENSAFAGANNLFTPEKPLFTVSEQSMNSKQVGIQS